MKEKYQGAKVLISNRIASVTSEMQAHKTALRLAKREYNEAMELLEQELEGLRRDYNWLNEKGYE